VSEELVVIMTSTTIFYEDLGVDMKSQDSRDAAAKHWSAMNSWLEDNCVRSWNCHNSGVWFLSADDAILFKLAWAARLK
jgi:hypothetical protein